MKSHIVYRQHKVTYTQTGNGNKYIIAFHGVKQDSDAFTFLSNTLSDFTIIAFDLPFHGATIWNNTTLNNEDVISIAAIIMQQFRCTQIHLLAYSIGAKCASVILQEKPEWIQSVLFIAPDGITENFWYKMATGNMMGKPLFKIAMQYPVLTHSFINGAASLKFVKKSYADFYKKTIGNRHQAMLLYNIWHSFSFLKVDITLLIKNVNTCHIPFTLVVGKYDKIIPESRVKILAANIHHIAYTVLPKAHGLLQETVIPVIQKHFTDK